MWTLRTDILYNNICVCPKKVSETWLTHNIKKPPLLNAKEAARLHDLQGQISKNLEQRFCQISSAE